MGCYEREMYISMMGTSTIHLILIHLEYSVTLGPELVALAYTASPITPRAVTKTAATTL